MNCPLTVKKIFFQLTNGDVQKANFDGQEGISQPDVDSEDTEAEWKLFWRFIFTLTNGAQNIKYYQS